MIISAYINGKATAEYVAWCAMKARCRTIYRAKGISVYSGWTGSGGFQAFITHIGPKPNPKMVVDRIDNHQSYVPGNVRWATRSQSNCNKSDNVVVTLNGETKVLDHWCIQYGITRSAVRSRLANGWPMDRAITEPIRKAYRHD